MVRLFRICKESVPPLTNNRFCASGKGEERDELGNGLITRTFLQGDEEVNVLTKLKRELLQSRSRKTGSGDSPLERQARKKKRKAKQEKRKNKLEELIMVIKRTLRQAC